MVAQDPENGDFDDLQKFFALDGEGDNDFFAINFDPETGEVGPTRIWVPSGPPSSSGSASAMPMKNILCLFFHGLFVSLFH